MPRAPHTDSATSPGTGLATDRGAGPGADGWLDPALRLHVVTGKGGTGKTTLAAALALALAEGGRRVLLIEVEGRQALAPLFGVPSLPYEERLLARLDAGGQVLGMAVDAEPALLEYLELFYKLGRAGRALRSVGAIDFVTTIAPGLRDVLLTGKVYEAVGRRTAEGAPAYDAVVLDAPPTGRVGRFLGVTREVAGIAGVGPVRGQAESVMELLRSPRAAVHLVTVLEELPVQESCEAAAELRGAGLRLGALFLNRVRPPVLEPQHLAAAEAGRLAGRTVREEVGAALRASGLDASPRTVRGLLEEAGEHARRVARERAARAVLAGLGLPTYELPVRPGGQGLAGLAARLREQGVGR